MELIRTFEQGKLTSDLNDSHIPKGYIKDAQNIRFASTEHDFGGVGVVSNVKGNIDFTYQAQGVPLTYSQNDIIKSASKLDAKGWICYFLYNSISTKSYIFLRDVNNNANSKILLSSNYTNLNLRFQLSETIDSDMCYVDEDRIYVFWCDTYGVRYLNIVKALAGQYGDVSDLDISICKYSPLYCATFIPTGSGITENLVTIEAYQYTYRYIYYDNTSSYFSPYSSINFNPKKATLLSISVNVAFVKKVEVFTKDVLGNNSNFYLIGVIENNDGSMLSIGEHTIEHIGSSYMAITEPDMDKFNNVPVSASSLTLVNHNVLALSGYKSFYDDWDDKKYKCSYTVNEINQNNYTPKYVKVDTINQYDIYEPSGTFLIGDVVNISGSVDSGGNDCLPYFDSFIINTGHPLLDDNYSKFENRIAVPFCLLTPNATGINVVPVNGDRQTGLALACNGDASSYFLCLYFNDKYGRTSNAYPLTNINSNRNNFNSIEVYDIKTDVTPSQPLTYPEWATDFGFGITKDIRYSKYVEVPFGNAAPPHSGHEHDFGLDYDEGLGLYVFKMPAGSGYIPSQGDKFICNFYWAGVGSKGVYRLSMQVKDIYTSLPASSSNPNLTLGNLFTAIIIDKDGLSIADSAGISTTANTLDYVEKIIFYEKQNNVDISTIPFYQLPYSFKINQFNDSFRYTFADIGDYYLKSRKTTNNGDGNDIKFYLEKSNITIGKPIIYEKNPIRIWNNTVIHSGEIIPQTNVNNLNKFYYTAYQDCDRSKGVIKRIRYDDSRGVVVWFENGIERIPVNSSLVENVDSKTLAISAKLLNLPQAYEGNYGIGNAVNTLAKLGTQWFWLDPINKCVARLGGDGVKDISEIYGMKKFMLDNTSANNKLLDNIAVGGADTRNGEYILTIFQSEYPTYKTLSFSVKNDGFSSFWSYLPQYIISCQNMLFTFNGGKLYKHGVGAINIFYGSYASSKITLLFNEEIGLLKTFKRLEIRSDKLWIPSLIKTDFGINISDLDSSSFTHDGGYDNINKNFITDKIANVEVGGDIKEFNGYMLETTLEYSGNEPNYLNFIKIIY